MLNYLFYRRNVTRSDSLIMRFAANLATIMLRKLKGLFLCFLNVFKRALCFIRRRPPPSPVLPVVLADAKSVAYDIPELGSGDTGFDSDVAVSWDSWDNDFHSDSTAAAPPQSFPPHHPAAVQPALEPETPEEPDYFADMTPASFKAPKIVVRKKTPPESVPSRRPAGTFSDRLSITDNASDGFALTPPQELASMDEWGDSSVNAWADEENEELDWEVEYALRETRRAELERKKMEQQQRRMQRELQRGRSQPQLSQSHFQTINALTQ